MAISISTAIPPDPADLGNRQQALRRSAVALEESFLGEMLRLSGVARPPDTGGGGAGEDAFAGFLADAYAAELAGAGGVGLAEQIYRALLARESSDGAA
ncbi:rod-binding protein [Halovulum marinum]|nr:rod-binding protein [Halovulum marinum]